MAEITITDDMFEQYAKRQEQESKLGSSKSTFQKNYEDIKYTGLTRGIPSIIRAVDGPPNTKLSNYTARYVTIAKIIDDNGKQMKVIRPSFEEDPNYILNKIISRVRTPRWIKNPDGTSTKIFPVKETNPEIFNLIEKNGLDPSDKKIMFDSGWAGKEVLMVNVIDRAQMDWHRENKHTMLLAKSVTENDNGGAWVEEGISKFGVSLKLNHLFKSYGSWEKYDIAITRTGDKNNAFTVICASETPKEVDEELRSLISTETHLTDEERSWEKYDLDKLYRVTTATKLYNRLKNTIKKIDRALGTDFLSELEEQAIKEKEKFAELYGDQDNAAPVAAKTPAEQFVEQAAPAVAPVRHAVRNVIPEPTVPGSNLPYFTSLTPSLQAMIKSAKKVGNDWEIDWDAPVETLAQCPTCHAPSPLEATKCPACGMDFV